MVALNNPERLEFLDLLQSIKSAASLLYSESAKVDSLVKFTLVSKITETLPKALAQGRRMIVEQEPLRTASMKATEKHITRRIELIKEMESALTEVIKMPWIRIRAVSINEMAWVYSDLARDLKNIAPPKELIGAELASYEELIQKIVLPFEEKGSDMRSKAFEMVSRFSVESEVFKPIADVFFLENPSQSQALKKIHGTAPQLKIAESLLKLDGKFFKHMDSEDWVLTEKEQLKTKPGSSLDYAKVRWLKALETKNWNQLAFFTQELNDRKWLSAGAIGLTRAISLSAIGAQAEALNELEENQKNLTPSAQAELREVLVQYRWNTYSVFKGVDRQIQAASH